jgi:acyl carrier protein
VLAVESRAAGRVSCKDRCGAAVVGDIRDVSSMSEQEIYAALTDIFRDVFASQTLQLGAGTSAKEIEGWDSFAQINLIVAAEARFGVRFRSSEAQGLKNVGDLVRVLQLKRA